MALISISVDSGTPGILTAIRLHLSLIGPGWRSPHTQVRLQSRHMRKGNEFDSDGLNTANVKGSSETKEHRGVGGTNQGICEIMALKSKDIGSEETRKQETGKNSEFEHQRK